MKESPVGSTLAGLVWAYDLSRATGDSRASDLLMAAAGRFQPRGEGQALAATDPDFRVEDMFMAAAVLGRAYRLSGDAGYVDILADFSGRDSAGYSRTTGCSGTPGPFPSSGAAATGSPRWDSPRR